MSHVKIWVSGPGRHHEAVEEGGAFHVRPTDAFARRAVNSPWGATVALAVLFGPAVWALFHARDATLVLAYAVFSILGAAIIFAPAFQRSPRDPLVVWPDGRLKYRGCALRPAGPVSAVRVFRHRHFDEDVYSVECLGSDGQVVVLPGPDFGDANDVREVAVLAAWLAQVFGAPVVREISDGPTEAETRKTPDLE